MWRIHVILISILMLGQISKAQNWFFNKTDIRVDSLPQKVFLQLRYEIGRIANTNTDAIKYIESHPYQAVDVRFGMFGYGKRKWHQLHHYPTYGLGVGKYFFQPSDNILGNPVVAYLFFNETPFRFKRASIGYDFSMGLAFHWKAYDSQTNPDQLVIGSAVAGLLGLKVQYELALTERVGATFGIGINHFSNGRIRSPNRGLNLYGIHASIRYGLSQPRSDSPKTSTTTSPEKISYVLAPFKPFYEFYAVGSIGFVTTFQDRDNPAIYYMAGSASVDAARHYRYKGKYGLGFDWSYDESLKVVYQNDYPGGVPTNLLYWPGIHLSHEYMVHRWTFITQAGVNLKVTGDKGTGFGRVAIRYDLGEHVFIRVGLRVYKTIVSDFIEWGVGYSVYKGTR